MANGVWLGANIAAGTIWVLEHEGDYNKGDVLIHVTVEAGGTVVRTMEPADE